MKNVIKIKDQLHNFTPEENLAFQSSVSWQSSCNSQPLELRISNGIVKYIAKGWWKEENTFQSNVNLREIFSFLTEILTPGENPAFQSSVAWQSGSSSSLEPRIPNGMAKQLEVGGKKRRGSIAAVVEAVASLTRASSRLTAECTSANPASNTQCSYLVHNTKKLQLMIVW